MKLSIQIPITPDRMETVKPLLSNLLEQTHISELKQPEPHIYTATDAYEVFEIIMLSDNKEMSIGAKRNDLYQLAKGEYSWQIDSDDNIAKDAISLILSATADSPDCITFEERCIINGVHLKSNHSLKYKDWDGLGDNPLNDGFHFHRTPFMKSVIRTDLALSVPVPDLRFGEDHAWARLLNPKLKSEVHIDKELYLYEHTTTPFKERYGII